MSPHFISVIFENCSHIIRFYIIYFLHFSFVLVCTEACPVCGDSNMGVIRKDATAPSPSKDIPASSTANTDDFESLVVLQFSEKVSHETVEWLLGKIQGSRYEGGAELQARTVFDEKKKVS